MSDEKPTNDMRHTDFVPKWPWETLADLPDFPPIGSAIEVQPMTDEELGRAWCERNGKIPKRYRGGAGGWYAAYEHNHSYQLPPFLFEVVKSQSGVADFDTEELAYAALGAALRRLVEFADEVREVLG